MFKWRTLDVCVIKDLLSMENQCLIRSKNHRNLLQTVGDHQQPPATTKAKLGVKLKFFQVNRQHPEVLQENLKWIVKHRHYVGIAISTAGLGIQALIVRTLAGVTQSDRRPRMTKERMKPISEAQGLRYEENFH